MNHPTISAFILSACACTSALTVARAASAGPPEYTIVDLGIINAGDFGLQGLGLSASGDVLTGRSLGVSNQGFSWTEAGGMNPLPNLASRPFGRAESANDAGVVVGIGATTAFGSGALPLVWEGGVASVLPLPAGESLGRAYAINNAGIAVGSVDGGSAEEAAIYMRSSGSRITTAAADGSMMTTAFGINDTGLVAGIGQDPNNAARNVGLVYDSINDTMVEVGALSSANGAIAFGISNGGHVVGSSMMNQGSGRPFIWTSADGIMEIPLPAGTSQGSARGVNSDGWVVGVASNAFAIPFVSDGTTTWALGDLLPAGTDWDLSMNTSSSALDIGDNGVIVGTGEFDGQPRAYAMIPVMTKCAGDVDGSLTVDFIDLTSVLSAWGPCPGCSADLDDDDEVGFSDLLIVLGAFGNTCPG